MITLNIENEKVEQIFLNEFHSNKEKFFEFIQSSYEKLNVTKSSSHKDLELMQAQESAMSKTWDNDEDKAWNDI